MTKSFARPVAVVAVLAFGGSGTATRVVSAAPIACESLGQMALTNGTLLSAESIPAGRFTPPTAGNAAAATFASLPAFCAVSSKTVSCSRSA